MFVIALLRFTPTLKRLTLEVSQSYHVWKLANQKAKKLNGEVLFLFDPTLLNYGYTTNQPIGLLPDNYTPGPLPIVPPSIVIDCPVI